MPPSVFPSISAALAGLSIYSSDDWPLSHLPKEIIIGMAKYLDHRSLVQLGATCSTFWQLTKNDVDGHWKLLHDKNWSSGKLLHFNGPPSQRPRDGVVPVDDGRNWRKEFLRRVELDQRVLAILPLIADLLRREEESPVHDIIRCHGAYGADIYDQLRLLSTNPLYEEAATKILVEANIADAIYDLTSLYHEPNLSAAGYEDVMMVASKIFQSQEDLMRRNSLDDIYDEINLNLDQLTAEDLSQFEHVGEDEDGGVSLQRERVNNLDAIFLDKVLENRKGVTMTLAALWWFRVKGADSMPYSKAEWWDMTASFIYRRLVEEEDDRLSWPLLLFRETAGKGSAILNGTEEEEEDIAGVGNC